MIPETNKQKNHAFEDTDIPFVIPKETYHFRQLF